MVATGIVGIFRLRRRMRSDSAQHDTWGSGLSRAIPTNSRAARYAACALRVNIFDHYYVAPLTPRSVIARSEHEGHRKCVAAYGAHCSSYAYPDLTVGARLCRAFGALGIDLFGENP
jgi:hypothetical protein